MDILTFIEKFAEQFQNTPKTLFTASTIFREIDEWSSITALSVISMIDDEYGFMLRGTDIRGVRTIQDLYMVVESRVSNQSR